MPNQHYPHECDVLLENERNCLAFWTKISGNYHKKGLFKERTGTPDASARHFILEEMKSMQKLPYIGKKKQRKNYIYAEFQKFRPSIFDSLLVLTKKRSDLE